MAQSLGKLLFHQSGLTELSVHRRFVILVILAFGLLFLMMPLKFESFQPTVWDIFLWNFVFRMFGAILVFIGVSGIWLLGKELIEIYEKGLTLRTSLAELWAGVFGRPPRIIQFREISEIFLNEDIRVINPNYRTRRGPLTGRRRAKAEEMVRKQGGKLPAFVIKFQNGKTIWYDKSEIRDWGKFLGALEGKVKINREEYHFLG